MDVFEGIADTAEAVARDQRALASQALGVAHARRDGTPWSEIVDAGMPRTMVDRLRQSAARLNAAAAQLRATVARALSGEGRTTTILTERPAGDPGRAVPDPAGPGA